MNKVNVQFSCFLNRSFTIIFTCFAIGFGHQKTIQAVPVDMSSYDSKCGVEVQSVNNLLTVKWNTPEGYTEIKLNISGNGSLIKSIKVKSATDNPITILDNAHPAIMLTISERDLNKRNGWTIFFDRVDRKPRESEELKLKPEAVIVKSIGQRCFIDINKLEGQSFSGRLRFIIYEGCDLIHVRAIVKTQQKARALLYHAGLTCDPEGKAISWIGLDDTIHITQAKPRSASPQKTRHRTIAIETDAGGVAIFPPPKRYFYPLDEAYNLGFTWWGSDFMNILSGFGIGIRQDPRGDRRWIPWFNAPPNTEQELDMFWLPSRDRGEKLFDHVKAYTNGDQFPELSNHKTFTSHYHIEHTTSFIEELAKNKKNTIPKAVKNPEFINVFKNAGIQIVHLAEFHNKLGPARRNPEKSLPMLKALHDECSRLSDNELLLLPGEEPNVHLGGHWISFFPKPVMWVLSRPKGKPFTEIHPEYGKVYYVGSSEDVLKLMELEKGLMWAAHPRIKSSTGYPDRYRNKPFFKSDRYLGGAWKAMPADLSKPRLGWRVLDLLDDTSNWGNKKYIVGEVDIFQVDDTTEFYAHANVNYLRLNKIPHFQDGWDPVLKALRDGAFFISTGEVLMPVFTVNGKASGETLKLNTNDQIELKAQFQWTFPMNFAEIIMGDGKNVSRKRIHLPNTGAFGKQTIKEKLNLKGKSWIRIEAWDIAANGVMSQPIWIE